MNSGLILIAVCYLFSATLSLPVQNGMIFYQPSGYYGANQHQRAYRQAMLLHYAQQPYYGRSAGAGMSAFATGESIAAGSYLQDCDHHHKTGNKVHVHDASASEQHDTYENSDDVSAFAEAYPADPAANDDEVDQHQHQRQEEHTNEVLPQHDSIPVVENPEPENVLAVQADPAVPAPLAPFPPTKPNKVHVELDTSAAPESDDVDEENDEFSPVLPPKKTGKNNGNGVQVPPYSFFPNIFSDASGATIAVANAYSNGKGGARSHAIAYGSRGSPKRGSNKKRFADVE